VGWGGGRGGRKVMLRWECGTPQSCQMMMSACCTRATVVQGCWCGVEQYTHIHVQTHAHIHTHLLAGVRICLHCGRDGRVLLLAHARARAAQAAPALRRDAVKAAPAHDLPHGQARGGALSCVHAYVL